MPTTEGVHIDGDTDFHKIVFEDYKPPQLSAIRASYKDLLLRVAKLAHNGQTPDKDCFDLISSLINIFGEVVANGAAHGVEPRCSFWIGPDRIEFPTEGSFVEGDFIIARVVNKRLDPEDEGIEIVRDDVVCKVKNDFSTGLSQVAALLRSNKGIIIDHSHSENWPLYIAHIKIYYPSFIDYVKAHCSPSPDPSS